MGSDYSVYRKTKIWKVPDPRNSTDLIEKSALRFRSGLQDTSCFWIVLRHQEGGETRVFVDGKCILRTSLQIPVIDLNIQLNPNFTADLKVIKNTSWIDFSWRYRYQLQAGNRVSFKTYSFYRSLHFLNRNF